MPNRVALFATLLISLNVCVCVCVCVCVQRQGLHGSLYFAFLRPRFSHPYTPTSPIIPYYINSTYYINISK